MTKLVRLVALTEDGRELGAIDGTSLSISATDDGELQVANGALGLGGWVEFGWEDLVPDYRRGDHVRVELQIIEREEGA